jgi:nucleoside-diphosphate-sugar epimerase
MNGPAARLRSVLVLGATSQIGFFLLPLLAQRGIEVAALTRRPDLPRGCPQPGVRWHTYSTQALAASLAEAGRFDAAVCLAPLPGLLPLLDDLAGLGVRRLVAFGTTARFYKSASADPGERHLMQELVAAEAELPGRCEALDIAWTLFRPTLVYGCGRDGTIMFIAWFVRRFGFFPLSQGGRGLRQPVHAADLARACAEVLDNPRTCRKAYDLSGGTTVTYRQMVEAVFRQLGRPALTPPVPFGVFRTAIAVAKRLPRLRGLSAPMAARMGSDMCFDHQEATQDFGFHPRPFGLDDLAIGEGSR